MERCVRRVMRQGHDKSAAIAICTSSIAGRIERRKQLSLKAPNYGARAGQAIVGNLARGNDGKFTRADGSAASGREVRDALTARPKKAGGSKRAAASPEQQAAAFERAGVGGDAQALRGFAKGAAPDGAAADRLIASGLAERGRDGTLRMTSAGRGVVRAAERGDVQAAADAASRGRDAVGKREERAAAKVSRDQARAEAQAQRAAERERRRAETERRRGEAQGKRDATERQRIGDRAEELVALVDQDERVTEFERTQRINRLEDLSRRLERVGGDDATQRKINGALRKLRAEAEADGGAEDARAPSPAPIAHRGHESLHVFKAADGWRWLGVTSNAYEDREREIVSTKALEDDADRMEAAREYGPLRWWHVGEVEYARPLDWTTAIAGPGVDIGTCDISMVVGRMAVEGGTLHPAIGPALAMKASEFQMSRGFAHPANEPDGDGVYHHIRTFERSLLPRGKAANPFTAIQVNKEQSDMATMKEKMQVLADKFFGGDAAKAEQVVAEVTATDKSIEASGVAFKEGATTTAAAVTPVTTTAIEPVTASVVTVKADEVAAVPEAPAEVKAEGEEMEAETEDTLAFVGDMTIDELVGALAPALAKAMADAMAPAMSELDATKGALAEAQKELSALRGVATKESSAIAALDGRVKELEGDAPGARGYRATGDAATIRTKEQLAEAGIAGPQKEDELTALVNFMFKG